MPPLSRPPLVAMCGRSSLQKPRGPARRVVFSSGRHAARLSAPRISKPEGHRSPRSEPATSLPPTPVFGREARRPRRRRPCVGPRPDEGFAAGLAAGDSLRLWRRYQPCLRCRFRRPAPACRARAAVVPQVPRLAAKAVETRPGGRRSVLRRRGLLRGHPTRRHDDVRTRLGDAGGLRSPLRRRRFHADGRFGRRRSAAGDRSGRSHRRRQQPAVQVALHRSDCCWAGELRPPDDSAEA